MADIAFIDGQLYAVLGGGGCSHGNPDIPNAVIKVDRYAGTWRQVADLSQFVMEHPAAHTNPGDFEPDETFYSMIAVRILSTLSVQIMVKYLMSNLTAAFAS